MPGSPAGRERAGRHRDTAQARALSGAATGGSRARGSSRTRATFPSISAPSRPSTTCRSALEPGEVVGLMGDNGAGKSTLVKMIAGNFRPSARHACAWTTRELVLHRPVEARQHGIEIVHQDLALCDNLTAAANVFLGRELRARLRPVRHSRLRRACTARAGEIFAELKSETRPRDLVKQMSGGQRQAVAIARTQAVGRQDRADGRADRGDLGAPGGRGAEPHPPAARPGHRRRPDQPPHARRLHGRRPRHRHAARPQGRRQDRSPTVRPRKSPASSPAPSSEV